MYDFDPKKDYYKILDVSEDASQDDIKKAFKKLAVKLHPDKGGDKNKFQEVNEAYQILSDSRKKQQYDAMKKGGFDFGAGDNGGFGGFGGDFAGGVDLGDVVSSIFGGGFGGGGRTRSNVRRGEDIKDQISISFEDAFLGVEKKISYNRYVFVNGAKKDNCNYCNGRGVVIQKVQTPFGVMQTESGCPRCQGLGGVYKKDGKELPNYGLERHNEIMTIRIPAGINDGVFIKYPNKGNEGIGGGSAGDLYIKINITKSNIFERKGDDLYVNVDVSIFDMILGGECDVPHPESKIRVKIPKGTQIGDLIKVSGKGFGEQGVFKSKGNLYIKPKFLIPKRLTKEQEKLRKQLKDAK